MRKQPLIAALLSTVFPGLGQFYAGDGGRGALILIAVIIAQTPPADTRFWAVSLPRFLHDLFAFYSVMFLLWQIADAFRLAKKTVEVAEG